MAPFSLVEGFYHAVWTNFRGAGHLTDTFQLAENNNSLLEKMFPENSKRIIAQKKAPLRVIVGNPPYSIGQSSANDNSQNQKYPKVENRIEETYVKDSSANLSKALYDSYIKAFRWASDRLDSEHGGVIAYISNAGWLDGNAMDGFRNCLEKEFNIIYVFNLRGNQRTSGELSRKEGGKIFGAGSRTPIAITILVKKPNTVTEKAQIYYHDIGDYLSREEKLAIIQRYGSIGNPNMSWITLTPNAQKDWLDQRNESFSKYIPIDASKKYNIADKSYFICNSLGLATNRDYWLWNSSNEVVRNNVNTMLTFYNQQSRLFADAYKKNASLSFEEFVEYAKDKIVWTDTLLRYAAKGIELSYDKDKMSIGLYRPFYKQRLYYDKQVIHRTYQQLSLFPSNNQSNILICVSGIGSRREYIPLITNCIPDLNFLEAGAQCFPLYYYEERNEEQSNLFDETSDKYIRRDAISDFIHNLARELYGGKVSKEDIFYYVYGFLHCPSYREQYSADLKKMLPRIPLVAEPKDFWSFSKAGRALAELHTNYESIDPYPLEEIGSAKNLRVEKMRFPSKNDKSSIIYNTSLTLSGIPAEAYEYVVNGRTAIEWIMERYQVRVDSDSGIKNDPNDWCKEVGNPRYIVDLVKRIVRVSIETMKIVNNLPKWEPEK
jgi:predicted helicase